MRKTKPFPQQKLIPDIILIRILQLNVFLSCTWYHYTTRTKPLKLHRPPLALLPSLIIVQKNTKQNTKLLSEDPVPPRDSLVLWCYDSWFQIHGQLTLRSNELFSPEIWLQIIDFRKVWNIYIFTSGVGYVLQNCEKVTQKTAKKRDIKLSITMKCCIFCFIRYLARHLVLSINSRWIVKWCFG